jgi:hypothetical protein
MLIRSIFYNFIYFKHNRSIIVRPAQIGVQQGLLHWASKIGRPKKNYGIVVLVK